MSDASTKIETLAEAIETLAISVAVRAIARRTSHVPDQPKLDSVIDDARIEIRRALREFLAPSLRIVNGSKQDVPLTLVPYSDRPRCLECLNNTKCTDPDCPHWAAAIRTVVAKAKGDVA